MWPLTSELECAIAVPRPRATGAAGILAWLDKHFQLMGADIRRTSIAGREVTLFIESEATTPTPRSLRHLRRIEIEVQEGPSGYRVYFTASFRPGDAVWGLVVWALVAAVFPYGGILGRFGVGLLSSLVLPLAIEWQVAAHLRGLCVEIEQSYREDPPPAT